MLTLIMSDGRRIKFHAGASVQIDTNTSGPYRLVVRDSSGNELARFSPPVVDGYVADNVAWSVDEAEQP